MKNKLLILFIFLSAALYAQDTVTYFSRKGVPYKRFDYVEDLSDMINVSPFMLKSSTGFTLSGDAHIDYAPNEGVSLGIKLQHKWLGLAISYSPKKLQDQDIGESDFINIVLNSYGRSFGFDAYYLTYTGYLIANIAELDTLPRGPKENKSPNRFRYDLHSVNAGFNAYYIFNSKKFSYRATFLQNEWQKKSAGSFLLTGSFNYYKLEGDSTVLPVRYDPRADEQGRLKSGDFYSFALMPGYGHTFVVFKRFFLSISASTGAMVQFQNYQTEHDLTIQRISTIPRGLGRGGIGYNSRRFYCGLSYITDVYNIQLAKGTRINNQINSATLFIGFRFNVPRSLQKYSDFLGKCDPLNLLSFQYNKN